MITTAFPRGFLWGAATSSYQIEGARDRRGESIWDRFSHTPGKIEDGSTGDKACDHCNSWPEDVSLMHSMGINAYRFSVSWPRVLPEGKGIVSQAGLEFYDQLVDALLEKGIVPFLTLYHWDLPQSLQEEGGWCSRSTASGFVEYARVMTKTLGDRVKNWMTLNEPFVSANHGYLTGEHAPGHKDMNQMLAAAHHLLLAHGLAVDVIREEVTDANVGLAKVSGEHMAASTSLADRAAAFRSDGIVNRWYLDPIAGRGYPTDLVAFYDHPMDFVLQGDMGVIAAPIDFLGINYYTRTVVRADEIPESDNLPVEISVGDEKTEMDWEVYPEGLYDALGRLHFDYRFPALYVTENGAAFADHVGPDGEVHDPKRIAYLKSHIQASAKAIQAGIPLKGYFAWSFMDNFEWACGYSKRFGLVYVDFENQRRIPKDSAKWYRNVIESGGIVD